MTDHTKVGENEREARKTACCKTSIFHQTLFNRTVLSGVTKMYANPDLNLMKPWRSKKDSCKN